MRRLAKIHRFQTASHGLRLCLSRFPTQGHHTAGDQVICAPMNSSPRIRLGYRALGSKRRPRLHIDGLSLLNLQITLRHEYPIILLQILHRKRVLIKLPRRPCPWHGQQDPRTLLQVLLGPPKQIFLRRLRILANSLILHRFTPHFRQIIWVLPVNSRIYLFPLFDLLYVADLAHHTAQVPTALECLFVRVGRDILKDDFLL